MTTTIRLIAVACHVALTLATTACMSGITGNDSGSTPVNESEGNEYKKAVVRCYKTGGTRVVKIMGELRCY